MEQNSSTIEWLLEEENPTVRYLTLKILVGKKDSDPQLKSAHKKYISEGVIAKILSHMKPEGYWVKPGPGYSPKYKSIVWSLILLGQIGAKVDDDNRIQKACDYYMANAFVEGGYITHDHRPSGTFDCLQGNMLSAFMDLEFKDKRLDSAFEWMARSVTGDGVASVKDRTATVRYNSIKHGPNFECSANGYLPCAWGGTKVMLAFSKLPQSKRTKLIDDAIKQGAKFFLSHDLIKSDYPTRTNTPPSRDWQKFGFPVFYITDMLQTTEALINLGYSKHPKVQKAIDFILSKQDSNGRFNLDIHYNGKTWGMWGEPHMPNKWVTYRVYNALKSL